MKKLFLIFLLPLLVSCESEENKNSRLAIDKYSRKLSSITENVVSSRTEEGSQSKLTLNNFYSRHTSIIEGYINDLNFETMSPKYQQYRDYLIAHAKTLNTYLTIRKSAISDFSDTMSSYESVVDAINDYYDDISNARSSYYSSSYYYESARRNLDDMRSEALEFFISRLSYSDNVNIMDSLCLTLDSISLKFNIAANDTKLIDRLNMPTLFRDTIGDWLINNKANIDSLKLPTPK